MCESGATAISFAHGKEVFTFAFAHILGCDLKLFLCGASFYSGSPFLIEMGATTISRDMGVLWSLGAMMRGCHFVMDFTTGDFFFGKWDGVRRFCD